MEFELDLEPSDESISEIRNGLVEHNSQFLNGVERNKIAYYVTEKDKKTAGVTAEIFGSWLLINFLWVDKACRGSEVGSELIAKLETYAKSQGCTFAMVDTFSFQAKPFYEKLGYECQMTLEQYPVSHARHYFTKQLTSS
ncbi:putative Acyl-CoA N-acyltransferase [Vibrio nigripulchritudo SO65]|uniref:GNAT family N-acetyltransferase n=1 Tax=Vibrio nigripulchritudo TaxID=28173 RepID=UPI0003B21856|nr:GNAT family N-acetyltransferase [Vibrio nigripulchritudo]CCN33706.1 putative Acyl-CoA N-acyltransferase [Vibrio nigripulchritudo AM115]CCN41910.1 putative Acyl-CoA N-acyltransferase [Vibrio nigripulchritudo FTn2]CCN66297.1 putative Acyl-CoA N-acyltransferase [Vibrio nigripulchritudo POn4]CCN74654.1 putative Acyl-CoA N-acyltransferase [Vibrio nigripulchritudo SO65]